MPRKNAIIACKGIPNQSKAGTHGMSHMGAGFVCINSSLGPPVSRASAQPK